MARGSTVYTFDVNLSDVDRGVYAALALKVAQHPSESEAYLVTRILAYALEYQEGIAFSPGLSSAEDPALWVHDLTGVRTAWIEVGSPDAARLHKASKAADRVAVYNHNEPGGWLDGLRSARIHEGGKVHLFLLARQVILDVAASIERRNVWSLSRMDGLVYLDTEAGSFTLEVRRTPLVAA
jgi:uncharacterized protein YaeQ